jgi:hypothetical protein
MQPDFVQHPGKIEKTSQLIGRTAKGDSCHGKIWTFCREVQAIIGCVKDSESRTPILIARLK